MKTQFVEVTNGPYNWGKFMVQTFDDAELSYRSPVSAYPLLRVCGWRPYHVHLFDLQTGEGAMFTLGGDVSMELKKHRIHVCNLFEPFLTWLLTQPDLKDLPAHLDLPNEPGTEAYRRPGPGQFYRTRDGLVLCAEHAIAAFKEMTPPYVRRGESPIRPEVPECGMCGQPNSPGRTCKACGTRLDAQWPIDFCSQECGLGDDYSLVQSLMTS